MRYSIVFFTLFLCSILQAQQFKPFRVEVGLSRNSYFEENLGNGFGGYLAPRYSIDDRLIVGLHLESSSISNGVPVDLTTVQSSTLKSTVLFGEYLFNSDQVRPFVGLGIGLFSQRTLQLGTTQNQSGIDEINNQTLGVVPRLGLNAGHFRFLASLNFTGPSVPSYLGVNIGFEIGGGRN